VGTLDRTAVLYDALMRPSGARSRVLSLVTVILVFVMVAAAVAGFAEVSTQQRSMIALREDIEEMRGVHQSLIEADSAVLHYVLGEGGSTLSRYAANVELLKSDRGAVLGELMLEPVAGEAAPISASTLIGRLETLWDGAVNRAAAGDRAGAAGLLADGGSGALVSRIGEEVQRLLQRANGQFPNHDERIRLGTLLVLVLQVGSGTLAVLGLVYAFRSSAAEARGRASAVASANASREQVTRLFEMADVLQSASDHADANAVLAATARDMLPGVAGALYVFNNSRDRLVLSTAWGREDDEPLPETVNPQSCWAVKRGKPHLNHPDGKKLCCAHHPAGSMALELPMIARGEIVGLLQLFGAGEAAEADLRAVAELGAALADGMSLALANMALREKLRNQALRDPLTGLYNRRYMEDALQRFVRLAEREHRDISLVMVDLDHFKRLNDTYGHAFGDQILREASLALLGAVRETDIVCRYGGEELVVILPDCPLERAVDKAEMLRLRIADLTKSHGTEISASFGVSSVPHTSSSVSDLLSAADGALYKAKQGGRNLVVSAPVRPYRLDAVFDPEPDALRQAAE
jgi:diguanylate cyclase (GGDEF)-like protein